MASAGQVVATLEYMWCALRCAVVDASMLTGQADAMAVSTACMFAAVTRHDSCSLEMLPLASQGLAQLNGPKVQLCKLCMCMTLQHDRDA
jgi:hypothetical protein